MARAVNGFVGTFDTVEALTAKYDPAQHAGCSANVGTSPPYAKAWSDGSAGYAPPIAAVSSQMVRKRIMRPYWVAFRNYLLGLYPPVANTASVVYIDPTGSAGAGTFASPLNDFPASPAINTTYLIKEGTRLVGAGRLTGITQTGLVIGTYDAGSGNRVFTPARLATIDGNTYFRCALRWQGTSGTFTLSGVRIIGGQGTGTGVQQFESITAPAASVITIEHCVFESMGTYDLVSSQINNQAITVGGARLVARFNRITVEGDGLSHVPAATAGCEFIGNEIITPPGITVGGPDCIQVQRTTINPVGRTLVLGNWLDQQANTKQAFVLAGGTPQATGEEMFFGNNFCFGIDCSAPILPPFSNGQIAYSNDTTSVTTIVSNYFDQFTGWAGVGTNSILAHNIGIRDHAGEWLVGFSTKAASTGAAVFNNTAIALGANLWTSGATNKGYEFAGSGHTISNNISVNLGMRLASGLTETNSLFVGGRPTDLSNIVLALGSGSRLVTDAMLDDVGRPNIGSPALTGGLPVTFNSMFLRFPDIFGQTAFDTTAFACGAAQGWETL